MTDPQIDDPEYPNLLVVIGASAGGLTPLIELVRSLPQDLEATLVVATHRQPELDRNLLADVLGLHSRIKISEPIHGERLSCFTLFVGKPSEYLTAEGRQLHCHELADRAKRMQRIDELFHSAAQSAGRNTVGIILSGMLYDGVAGLQAIHEAGGRCIVQEPREAAFADMPVNALDAVPMATCGTAAEIATMVRDLAEGRSCR